MKQEFDPNAVSLETPAASRRRVLQMLGAASVAGLPAWSFGQPTAAVNTTKLAVTDTEVTVGQLHSSTGTMAISETGSIQAEQLAIDQINAMGGILGRKIKVIKEDGASDWPTFAEKSKKLLINDRCAAVFGCWTSASRKAVAARLVSPMWILAESQMAAPAGRANTTARHSTMSVRSMSEV